MKKLVVALLILGVGGWLIWRAVVPPERRACSRLAELCGQAGRAPACEQQFAQVPREVRSRFDTCVGEAKSCAEAAGCAAGAGVGALGDAVQDFIRGIGKGVRTK